MIDLKSHTKQEIIDHLLNNELKSIQKRFYSLIDDNRYNMIQDALDAIFIEERHGNSDEPGYVYSESFKKYSVKNLLHTIERNFELDKAYVIDSENRHVATYLAPSFVMDKEIFFVRDILTLLSDDVYISISFKIKNRWYSFTIDRDNIAYKPYKKYH